MRARPRAARDDAAPAQPTGRARGRGREPASSALPAERLASGPGLVAAAFGLDRAGPGSTCAIPASPLRLEAAPPDEPPPDDRGHAADRHRLRRRAVGGAAVAVRRARPPVGLRPGSPALTGTADGPPLDRACSSSRSIRARLADGHLVRAVAPAGRGARAVERPGRRRPRPRRDRPGPRACSRSGPGVGIGAAHDIGPAIERAARGGRLDPAQFLEIADTLDATARLATSLADERRPLLRDLGRELHAAARPALDAGAQLRPGRRAARHRLAAARRPAGRRPGRLRPPAAAARRARRRRSSAAPSRSRSSRSATAATSCRSRPRPGPGQGHRPRRVGQRPDAVHRAARRGRARQRLARGAGRRGRGDRAHPRRAVGARRRPTPRPLRETLDALARFDLWAAKASLAAEMDGDPRRDRRAARGRSCCRPATRA